ncbi:MAG TPA: Crp/Fnr family transcriptional regulator [Actinomycetota bacterium]|nr:Crp/Fnr family transcriptional regulator [Actinomycetota bacterium]
MAAHEFASLPLATELPPVPWLARLPRARSRWVPPDRVLVHQGERPSHLFVVEEGVVALTAWESSGRRAVLALLGPGDAFGEAALFAEADTPSHALLPEARVLVPSRVLAVPPEPLRSAVEAHAWLAAWLALTLARRARRAEERLAWTLGLTVLERVRAALQDLAGAYGRPTQEGRLIEVPLTQDFLASLVGATRESVNRAVRALVRSGALRRASGHHYLLRSAGPSAEGRLSAAPGRANLRKEPAMR